MLFRLSFPLPRVPGLKIEDTTALVTGANRGIGKALVEALLAAGAGKVYATARDTDKLPFTDNRVQGLPVDVTDAASVGAAADAAGDIDLVISNAGVLNFASFLDGDLDVLRQDMEVNYFGALNVARAFAPALRRTKGAFVNLNSVVSYASMPAIGGYSASKAAAHSLTLALRAELGPDGVTVLGVYPGPIDTDMAKDLPMDKHGVEDTAAAILRGIESGDTHIAPDPMAEDVRTAYFDDPRNVEKQFASTD